MRDNNGRYHSGSANNISKFSVSEGIGEGRILRPPENYFQDILAIKGARRIGQSHFSEV